MAIIPPISGFFADHYLQSFGKFGKFLFAVLYAAEIIVAGSKEVCRIVLESYLKESLEQRMKHLIEAWKVRATYWNKLVDASSSFSVTRCVGSWWNRIVSCRFGGSFLSIKGAELRPLHLLNGHCRKKTPISWVPTRLSAAQSLWDMHARTQISIYRSIRRYKIDTFFYIYMNIYICTSVDTRAYVSIYQYICWLIDLHTHIYIYICAHQIKLAHTQTYIYICKHIYTHICINVNKYI